MKLIGTTPIHPFWFFTGKISGYITWIVYFLTAFHLFPIGGHGIGWLTVISHVTAIAGLLLIFFSLINLGRSTSLGVPNEATAFKNTGLYRFSRNPMYLGFHLLALAAVLLTAHPAIAVLGIYSSIVYHFIIKGEEKFLKERFGKTYTDYQSRVRRYI